MTDEQRKALTLYLGECWHEAEKRYVNLGGMNTEVPMWICKHCGDGSTSSDISWAKHRTFTTDADMMALFRKMVDNEKISRSAAIRLECPCYKFLYSMGG